MPTRTRQLARRLPALLGPVAPVALAIVLVAVSALSMWAAFTTSSAAADVERASRLKDLYQRARVDVAAEAEASAAYQLRPSPSIRAEYNRAAADLVATLEQIHGEGRSADRQAAERVLAMHQEYLRADARLFQAIDERDRAARSAVDDDRTRRLFEEVRRAVDTSAEAHRERAAARVAELQRTSRLVWVVVPVVAAVGMALVAFFAALLVFYRREVQQATEREIARLAEAALLDNLTGLGNHRSLHEHLPRLLDEGDNGPAHVAVVALDLDGLKEVNDTLGHHEGDQLIQRLAAGLRATLPEEARAYRVGGDEFIAVLPGASAAEAFHYSQQLQTHLAPPSFGIMASPEPEAHGATHVTVGVCDVRSGEHDAELTLQRADLALIEAKRLGLRGLIWSAGIEQVRAAADGHLGDHRRSLATALAKAVDAKDSYTRSHCETVSQLCVLIGEQLGMAAADIEQLRFAGLLHDVGKIGVPDAILQKPGALTDDEYREMQGHSTLGHSIVAAAQLVDEAEWVLHHHERIDGRGYPRGIAGEAIPLQSRIIFVADAFEAMTSDRPYRSGRPAPEALVELRRCAGTQFDPRCVEALERALEIVGPTAIVPASAVAAAATDADVQRRAA